jgi:hypothetical protein
VDAQTPRRSWAFTNADEKAAAIEAYQAFVRQASRGEAPSTAHDGPSPPTAQVTAQVDPHCTMTVTYFDGIFAGDRFARSGCVSILNLHDIGWGDRITSLIMAGGDPARPSFVNLFQDGFFGKAQLTLGNSKSIVEYDLTRFCRSGFIFCTGTWSNWASSCDQWRE